jgi:hypothetical protein
MLSLLTFASSEKQVDCNIFGSNWENWTNLTTCVVENQAINDVDFTIASLSDATKIKALHIEGSSEVKFIPENLSATFPIKSTTVPSNSSPIVLSRDCLI